MILNRIVAYPGSRRILRLHLFATPLWTLHSALVLMIPVLLRKNFDAPYWQVTIATMSIPVMLLLSVFWDKTYRRISPSSYLLLYWCCGILPLAGIALCEQSWTVLIFVIISAAGLAGFHPLNGDLLRACYPPSTRSPVFSLIQAVTQLTIITAAYLIGLWLDHNPQAFRIYMPLGVLLIALGVFLIFRMMHLPPFCTQYRPQLQNSLPRSLARAYHSMLSVLRNDRDFRRYEIGFFLYGMGWMICFALLPFLVVDELHLDYAQIAKSTQSALQVALLITLLPAGLLMKHMKPVRTAGASFLLLALYPLGLMLAWNTLSLTIVTIVYGIALAGVRLTWTVGPVTLARDASRASQYLAIHAALVGVRALCGQFPAVAVYNLTGDIRIPLIAAALFFLAGAIVMFRLHRDLRTTDRTTAPSAISTPQPPAN